MSTFQGVGRDPTLAEVIRNAMDARLRGVRIALPGEVISYDANEQKADIKPLIKDLVPTREGKELLETLPVIPNVPVIWQRAGGFLLTMPLAKGDKVLLLANDRSIDNWVSGDGREQNPDDFRTHSLSDCVAYPGFYPFSAALGDTDHKDHMVLGREGGTAQVHIKADEVSLYEENAADFVALAQKVLDELQTQQTNIQSVLTFAQSLKSVFSVGVPVPTDGGAAILTAQITASNLITPPTLTAPSSVAAAKVKAT